MTLARLVLGLAREGIVVYFLLLNTVVALLLLLAIRELWRHWHVADDDHLAAVLASEALPPLSILLTAHGAPAATSAELLAYLALEHPRHEVILVTDGVPEALAQEYELYQVPPAVMVTVPTAPVRAYHRSRRDSKLLILDKELAGRADALNAAVNAARYPYVLAMNTGTRLAHDALLRLARPFLLDKSIAVVGAAIRVADAAPANSPGGAAPSPAARWLRGVQTVESLRAQVYGRLGWNSRGGSRDMTGTLGLFLRDHVLAVGGYRVTAAGPDSDLVTRVHRYLQDQGAPAEVCLIPEPVAWAAPPTTRRELMRQRERWHRGLIELLASNRDLLFRPRYGATGLLVLPYLLLGEVLAPVVELAAYVCVAAALLGAAPGWGFVGLFLLVAPGYTMLLSTWAILLERSSAPVLGGVRPGAGLVLWALVEPIGYRQLLLWARLRTSWRFLRGRHSWRGTPRDVAVGRSTPVSEGI
jgi:cellulose synthase/poly-beta-1,6-N-acetylglucosamine synthase-like glycosyltransferase